MTTYLLSFLEPNKNRRIFSLVSLTNAQYKTVKGIVNLKSLATSLINLKVMSVLRKYNSKGLGVKHKSPTELLMDKIEVLLMKYVKINRLTILVNIME